MIAASANLAPPEVEAPAAWRRVDFISDLHLAPDTPRAFAAWRDYLERTPADAVFMLGDLFEAWVGDDARLEAGFEADAAAVLRRAAGRRALFLMVGNRDFLIGPELLADCGVAGLDDPTLLAAFGQRILLTHGDAWCLGDADYQKFRQQVRHPAWRAQVLGRSLAERRALAKNLRSESERRHADGTGDYADVDAPTALRALDAAGATVLVHGHTHRPETAPLSHGRLRHVLSDWDLDHALEADRAEVLCLTPEGWERLPLASAAPAR